MKAKYIQILFVISLCSIMLIVEVLKSEPNFFFLSSYTFFIIINMIVGIVFRKREMKVTSKMRFVWTIDSMMGFLELQENSFFGWQTVSKSDYHIACKLDESMKKIKEEILLQKYKRSKEKPKITYKEIV